MNILFLSTDEGILRSESESRARMTSYGALGERVEVLLLAKGARESRDEMLSKQVRVRLERGVRVAALVRAYRLGKRILREGGPWLVSSQDPFELGLLGFLLVRASGAKFQLQVHTDLWAPEFRSLSLRNRFQKLLAFILLPRADGIRVVSSRLRRAIERRRPKLASRTSVLPVLLARLSPAPYPGKPFQKTALIVSRLEREKGVDRAVRAFAFAARDVFSLGLVIAGEGSEQPALERLVSELGVSDRVRFLGSVADIAPVYAKADVLINGSHYEGYSRTLMEASLLEIPVVTTDVGVVGFELPKRDLYVAKDASAEALGKALGDVLANPAEATQKAKRARQAALNSVFTDTASYLERYRAVLAECMRPKAL